MFCSTCGTPYSADSKFCMCCGKPLNTNAENNSPNTAIPSQPVVEQQETIMLPDSYDVTVPLEPQRVPQEEYGVTVPLEPQRVPQEEYGVTVPLEPQRVPQEEYGVTVPLEPQRVPQEEYGVTVPLEPQRVPQEEYGVTVPLEPQRYPEPQNPVQPQMPFIQQTVPNQQNLYSVQPPMAPPKKKNATPIIIAVVACVVVLIGVIVAIIAFSGQNDPQPNDSYNDSYNSYDDNDSGNDDSDNTDAEEENTTERVRPELSKAEFVAKSSLVYSMNFEAQKIFNSEIIGYDGVTRVIDEYLRQENGVSTYPEAYGIISDNLNEDIQDADDFLLYLFETMGTDTIFGDATGNGPSIEYDGVTSEYITEDEASGYIRETRDALDNYSSYGISSSDFNWNDIEEYAKVEYTYTLSGIEDSYETMDIFAILGYIDGEWKILYIEEGGDVVPLFSVAFLDGLVS